MKLNRFNKKLKKEYDNTFLTKKSHFSFKLRYIFIGIAVALLLIVLGNHLYVIDYNNNVDTYNNSLSYNLDLSSNELNKVNSENEAVGLNESFYVNFRTKAKKTSFLQELFSMNLIGCTSGKSESIISEDMAPSTGGNQYETNAQVSGIDEADISKSDGEYIYSINSANDLVIYDLSCNKIATYSGDDFLLLFLYDDKIILLGLSSTKILKFENNEVILINSFNYRNYIDSRFTNGILYLFACNQLTNIDYEHTYYDGCSRIDYGYTFIRYDVSEATSKSVNIISSYDASLYVSNNNIFLYSTIYLTNLERFTSISIFDYNLDSVGELKAEGYALNQFSLDEYDGYLRVVTTKPNNGNYLEGELNELNIFDLSSLANVGSLTKGIGLGYQIVKSVSFNGNICYIVTYQNTDPLYEIDCSDVTNPRIVSEYKAPGYSSYLYNFTIGEKNYILGLGYTDNRNYKVSLYLSDNGSTQIGDDFILGSSSYDLTDYAISTYLPEWENHKALFLYNDSTNLFLGFGANDKYLVLKIDVDDKDNCINVYKDEEVELDYYQRSFLINNSLFIVTKKEIKKVTW